jgi:hypothetical protein
LKSHKIRAPAHQVRTLRQDNVSGILSGPNALGAWLGGSGASLLFLARLIDRVPAPADDAQSLKVGGKWGDLLRSIPEGENYLWHTDRGGGLPLFGWRTRYWSFLLKLAKRLPSWTIQAQPGSAIGPFHWDTPNTSSPDDARSQSDQISLALFAPSRHSSYLLFGRFGYRCQFIHERGP